MQRYAKKALAGLFLSALFFLSASPLAQAQLVAHSTDLAGYIGNRNVLGPSGFDYPYYGGSVGYNVVPSFTVLGEYAFMPMGSKNGISESQQLYGGAVHYNLLNIGRVGSYFVLAFDGDRNTVTVNGVSSTVNGYDVGFGGGWIFYVGHNWGLRPEIRADKQELLSVPAGVTYPVYNGAEAPANVSTIYVSGIVNFFYQFGGKGKKK